MSRPTVTVALLVACFAAVASADGTRAGAARRHASPALSNCASSAVTPARTNLNLDLQDFGRLFLDAGRPECAEAAGAALHAKLGVMLDEASHHDEYGRLVGPFQGWLEGAHVALAFATSLQLGGRGELDAGLDGQLRRLRASYRFAIDPYCGTNFENTCVDDYAIAADAYAWIAAYEARSGNASTARSAARESRRAIGEALAMRNHMCKVRHDDSLPSPCASFPDAAAGLASSYLELVSFNHGFQNVAYGIGLLPSISAAAVGLEVAGEAWTPSAENRSVADALFLEGQRAALPDGSDFRADCYRVTGGALFRDSPCADALNKLPPDDPAYDPNLYYLPRMMPVSPFFDRVLGSPPNREPFRYDELDPALFNNPFQNEGRLATSGYLGFYWWNPAGSPVLRPSLDGFRRPARSRPARR